MNEFRVIDLQAKIVDPNAIIVAAQTPEQAARVALGVELVRSGSKRDLRARVYLQQPGQPMSMVRLYAKAADR